MDFILITRFPRLKKLIMNTAYPYLANADYSDLSEMLSNIRKQIKITDQRIESLSLPFSNPGIDREMDRLYARRNYLLDRFYDIMGRIYEIADEMPIPSIWQ